ADEILIGHAAMVNLCRAKARETDFRSDECYSSMMPRNGSSAKARRARSRPSPLEAVLPTIAAATIRPAELLALQAFDVAARAGSFRDAGQSLNLTPSAISHRIRNLEASLGVALFKRTHRAVELTADGKRLAVATGKAFAELARAGSPSPDRSRRLRLRLKV